MKVYTLTGTNFEEFDIAFTASVRMQNSLIGIPLYYLLRPDAVINYNADWNKCEEKLIFCSSLQEQAFNGDAETLTTTNSWSNISAHMELSAILCLSIPGQRRNSIFILS